MESEKRITPKLTASQAAFGIDLLCESLTAHDQRMLRMSIAALIRNALSVKETLCQASREFLELDGRIHPEGDSRLRGEREIS